MTHEQLDHLKKLVLESGPARAIETLCTELEAKADYNKLFYALIMKARQSMGLCVVPTAPTDEIPREKHDEFEEVIRNSARRCADLHLATNDLEQAWNFYKMIGETEPIKSVIDNLDPKPEDDLEVAIRLAFYEGLNMARGYEWILERYGLCNAITTLTSQDFSHMPAVREHCLQKLIEALYTELALRLRGEIEHREGNTKSIDSIPVGKPGEVVELIKGREWLFAEDGYHIDLSHLSSTVQMSIHLAPCEALDRAIEFCEYGKKLSGRFLGRSEPPFENLYEGYQRYLEIIKGKDVEKNLDYFRQKAKENEENGSSYPAEILLQILERIGHEKEALQLAGKTLNASGLYGMCRKVGDYSSMEKAARTQEDPIHFLSAVIENAKAMQKQA